MFVVHGECVMYLIGVTINFSLLLNLLLRPILWSTVNTFLGVVIFLNIIFLSEKICLAIIMRTSIIQEDIDEPIILALENLFSDHQKSISCSTHTILYWVHGFSITMILLGVLFIRSIMIKHAEAVCPNSIRPHINQAEMKVIGLLVAILVFAICFGPAISFIVSPLFPFDFAGVQICRGIRISLSSHGNLKMIHDYGVVRVTMLMLTLLATVSCQVRIVRYQRRHNKSYFSHYRQNIVTANQTIAAIYLKIVLFLLREILFFLLIKDMSNPDLQLFMKIIIFINNNNY